MRYLSCGIPSWWNHAVGCCIINEKYSFDPSILDKCKYSSVFQEIIFDIVGKSFFWNICTSTRKIYLSDGIKPNINIYNILIFSV